MSQGNWDKLMRSLQLCLEKTLPLDLLNKDNDYKDKPEELDSLFTKCIT